MSAWCPREQRAPREGGRLQKPFAKGESTSESASTLSEALQATHTWTAMFSKSREKYQNRVVQCQLSTKDTSLRPRFTQPPNLTLLTPYFFTRDEGLASGKLNQDLLCRQDRASTPQEVPRLPCRAEQSSSLRALEGSAMLLTSEASPEEFQV